MRKVNVYVDGFNLYFAIKKAYNGNKRNLWLDLSKLASNYLQQGQVLNDIYYFSAFLPHDKNAKIRHQTYISALKSSGVNIVMGKYCEVTKTFNSKMKIKWIKFHKIINKFPSFIKNFITPLVLSYFTVEEKQTDVNIAIKMLSDVLNNKCDDIIIITADSDICPPITEIKLTKTSCKVTSVLPINNVGVSIQKISDIKYSMQSQHIKNSLFPDVIKTSNGSIIKPSERN